MMKPAAPAASKARILIFCRAYLVDDFRANVAPLESEFDFRFLCDGKKPGTDDTRARFYHHLRARTAWPLLSAEERDDVIGRCRLLRNIERPKAEALVNAMGNALQEWFTQTNPQAVLCHMVDEYVTHLTSIIARKRGIFYVGYAGFFFPGAYSADAVWQRHRLRCPRAERQRD